VIPFEFKAIAALLALAGLLLWAGVAVKRHDANVIAVVQGQAAQAAVVEEQRRVTAQSEVDNETQRLASLAAAARLRAPAVSSGLRDRTAALIASTRSCTAADVVGPPAPSAADLLADVQGRLEQAGGQLADEADARGIAGLAAERKYDALTAKP
jgi:Protein of unknown function (DUF2514)